MERTGGKAYLRVVGRDHDVAMHREVRAAGEAVAVHPGYDGFAQVQKRRPAGGRLLHPVHVPADVLAPLARPLGLLGRAGHPRRDVVSGAERPAVRPQCQHADIGIVVGPQGALDQLVLKLLVEGVQLFGPVERYAADAVGGFVLDEVVGHENTFRTRRTPAPGAAAASANNVEEAAAIVPQAIPRSRRRRLGRVAVQSRAERAIHTRRRSPLPRLG